ncbi:MAG: zinc ribbon domain-containing protein, partial [Flavobacteriaceae bacterium]|nr:zinc ribbon domain-containing protein [Flavobacteriaceae bacterium]
DIYLGQKMWVIKIPPHYTSQKCSRCGTIDKKNRLSQSKFKCLSCGFSMNADINAANNIRDTGACSFFQNFGSKECSLSNRAMLHRTFKTPLIIHGRKGKKGVSQHNSHEK